MKRFVIVGLTSLIFSWKVVIGIFSGFWRIPITCCQVSGLYLDILSKRIKIFCVISVIVIDMPLLAYTIYVSYIEKYSITNYKLFFSSLDLSIISAISIIISIIFLIREFQIPAPYKKYILEKVSNRSLAAYSIQVP